VAGIFKLDLRRRHFFATLYHSKRFSLSVAVLQVKLAQRWACSFAQGAIPHQTISEACEKAREFYALKSVVQLVVEGLDLQPGISVYDPTAAAAAWWWNPERYLNKLLAANR
jgi:hypothetical protein